MALLAAAMVPSDWSPSISITGHLITSSAPGFNNPMLSRCTAGADPATKSMRSAIYCRVCSGISSHGTPLPQPRLNDRAACILSPACIAASKSRLRRRYSSTLAGSSAATKAKATGSINVRLRTRSGASAASRRATIAPKLWPITSIGSDSMSWPHAVTRSCRSPVPSQSGDLPWLGMS